MNEAKVKTILTQLVEEIEHLRASLEVVAAVAGHQKGISTGKAAEAVNMAKFSNRSHYAALRKEIDGL